MKAQTDGIVATTEFLSSVELFSNLKPETIKALARTSKFQRFERGKFVFFQADPSQFAYIVQSGQISIVLSSTDGRDMVINEMRPGDLFGELGILTSQPRSTTAVARVDSYVLVIPRDAFLRLLDAEPQLARRILQITAERLQRSGKREEALAFMDAQARLARLLLELGATTKAKGYITISQDELAQRTGLIRQTVAKALGKWRRSGWLITGRGHIVILNHEALESLEENLLI